MAIQTGIGVVSYPRRMSRGLEGQAAESELPLGDTYRVPAVAQVNTITVGAYADDGDRIIVNVTLPDGTVVEGANILRAAGAPADAAAAATAIAAALNAHASLNNHLDASVNSNVVTVTFRHPNVTYTVATVVTGTTAAVAQTQAPGGTAATPGRFVSSGEEVGGIPLVATIAALDEFGVRGILAREMGQPINAESPLASAVDQIQPGSLCTVYRHGKVLMRNNGSVAAVRGGAVFVVINTAGGQELGMARADDDAANSIPLSQARAYWSEAVAVGAIGAITLLL